LKVKNGVGVKENIAVEMTKVIITLSPWDYDAVLFDLDGVLTKTARVHASAWKKLFDSFLEKHASQAGVPFVPFDINTDYPRYNGVADFLESRGIELPLGAPRPLNTGRAAKKD
jgi:hypothetical protein